MSSFENERREISLPAAQPIYRLIKPPILGRFFDALLQYLRQMNNGWKWLLSIAFCQVMDQLRSQFHCTNQVYAEGAGSAVCRYVNYSWCEAYDTNVNKFPCYSSSPPGACPYWCKHSKSAKCPKLTKTQLSEAIRDANK